MALKKICSRRHENSPEEEFCTQCHEDLRGVPEYEDHATQPSNDPSVLQDHKTIPNGNGSGHSIVVRENLESVDSDPKDFLKKRLTETELWKRATPTQEWEAPDGYERIGVNPVSKGGETVIWRVRRRKDDAIFLMKLYESELRDDVLVKLRSADSRHVAQIIAFGALNEATAPVWKSYLIEEQIGNGSRATLQHWIKETQGALPEPEAKKILRSLTDAIVYLHSLGILHRDIKPDNILVRSKTPKVNLVFTDFGSAKVVDPTIVHSRLVNTPAYAPPEAHDGTYTKESEYWSLGMIMSEITTGAHPLQIQGMDISSRQGVIQRFRDRKPLLDLSRIPIDWQRLLRGLLTHVYQQRWGSKQIYDFLDEKDLPEPPPEFEVFEEEEKFVPILVGDQKCETTKELASALAREWDVGKAKLLKSNDIESWLRADVKSSPELIMRLRDIVSRFDVEDDVKLFRVVLLLDPTIPLTYRGVALSDKNHQSDKDLVFAANEAFKETELENMTASKKYANLLYSLFQNELFDEYAKGSSRERYGDIAREWRKQVAAYDRAQEALKSHWNSQVTPPTRERICAFMLAAQLSPDFVPSIVQRLRDKSNDKELLRDASQNAWFAQIGEIKKANPPQLLLMLTLAPVAAAAVRNERALHKAEQDAARAVLRRQKIRELDQEIVEIRNTLEKKRQEQEDQRYHRPGDYARIVAIIVGGLSILAVVLGLIEHWTNYKGHAVARFISTVFDFVASAVGVVIFTFGGAFVGWLSGWIRNWTLPETTLAMSELSASISSKDQERSRLANMDQA